MPFNVDNSITNSDWIKGRTWDLGFTDLDGFFVNQKMVDAPIDAKVQAVEHFMTLPAYKPAPNSFKAQAIRFITVNR
jgi:hypothetical protein